MSTQLKRQPSSIANSGSHVPVQSNSQFKHTNLWNNIILNLHDRLLKLERINQLKSERRSKLRKQLSGTFMHSNNSHVSKRSDELHFNGSQCVSIIYEYLTSKEQTYKFENQVTREKVVKLCQMLMESGVFEPAGRSASTSTSASSSSRFDDNSFRNYRMNKQHLSEIYMKCSLPMPNLSTITTNEYHGNTKPCSDIEENEQGEQEETESRKLRERSKNNINTASKPSSNANDANKENEEQSSQEKLCEDAINKSPLTNNLNKIYNKSKLIVNKTSNVNVKLKRKITLMRRSTTVPSFVQLNEDGTDSISSSSSSIQAEKNLAKNSAVIKQITNEVIIEKLLTMIDLPIVENLLFIEEVQTNKEKTPTADASSKNDEHKMFKILDQVFDLNKCDYKEEWRACALDCLEFIDWTSANEKPINIPQLPNDKQLILLLMKDIELYTLIKNYYEKQSARFLYESFETLLTSILVIIRKGNYNKALDILNLGSLLLPKRVQAEFKRLLKFLYLTANSSHAPRLSEDKPNNSILLNHFANSLIDSKVITFEETRLLLNFMLNNFDLLFKQTKSIEELVSKRCKHMQKYGKEIEAPIENLYCKQMTVQQYEHVTMEETSKALVDLINKMIDDPKVSLKQKKLKLKALQRIHPDVYEKNFANILF